MELNEDMKWDLLSYELTMGKNMDKEIPKKPFTCGQLKLCPTCGSMFIEMIQQGFSVKLNHCGNCGQRLDHND